MKREERKRIDRKHRFPLRIDEVDHNEIDALAFNHNVSLNVMYNELIRRSLYSDAVRNELQEKFPRDERRGHFIYATDERVIKRGRNV